MEEKETKSEKKRKTVKAVFEVIFFAGMTALGLYYILKDDPKEIFTNLSQASFFPLSIAILLVLFTIFMDGAALTILAKYYHPKYKLSQGIINVTIGGFLGCYNHSASTLIQAYTFEKQDIKVHQGASILTMNFLMYQITLCLYSTIILFLGYPLLKDIQLGILGGMKIFYLCLIGVGYQLFFLLGIFLLGFSKHLHRFVINSGIDFLAKLHILRHPEETRKRVTLKLVTYRIELERLFKNKRLVIETLSLNLLKRLVNSIIPYVIFWSLDVNLSKFSFLACFSGSGYAYIISSFITVGAPEIVFQTIFSSLLEGATNALSASAVASAGNLIWRFLTFYLIFFLGAIAFLLYRGGHSSTGMQLQNTATIYDLEVVSLENNQNEATIQFLREVDDRKDKQKQGKLLSQKELEASLKRIQHDLLNRPQKEKNVVASDQELAKILEEQKKELAKALEEAKDLEKRNVPDQEIKLAAQTELEVSQKKRDNKAKKKQIRKEKRQKKKTKKLEKQLQKLQPKGSIVSYDTQKGIEIKNENTHQIRTYTTSDPDEDKTL